MYFFHVSNPFPVDRRQERILFETLQCLTKLIVVLEVRTVDYLYRVIS